ncbi:MAG: cation diffusion facilitator family transporter [bacterium]|nr:cation diffusion facilitator family transporter [bacterium]
MASRVLVIGICLFVFQIVFAILTGSISLLSDTAHIGGDISAIVLLFLAQIIANWVDKSTGKVREEHYHNVELAVTAVNGLILLIIAYALLREAIDRFSEPPQVSSVILVPGIVGFVVNSLMFRMLHRGRKHLAVQSAAVHVAFDLLASGGVILAGLLIFVTGERLVDPIISAVIIGLIFIWGIWLIAISYVIFMGQYRESDAGIPS